MISEFHDVVLSVTQEIIVTVGLPRHQQDAISFGLEDLFVCWLYRISKTSKSWEGPMQHKSARYIFAWFERLTCLFDVYNFKNLQKLCILGSNH